MNGAFPNKDIELWFMDIEKALELYLGNEVNKELLESILKRVE